jgi:protein-disulfide isomerase
VKWNSRQILILVAVVVVVAAAAIFFITRGGQSNVDLGTAGGTPTPAGPSKAELMVAGPLGEMTEGDANAPNTIVEYASMTCSHCANFHNTVYRDFKKKYIDSGKVFFIFREYPLDPLATSAAMLVRCGPKDREFPLIDLLFDNQDSWAFVNDPKTALINLVKQAGISEADFNACLTNQTILDGVNAVKERAAKQFGVDATPTFFINGVEHPGEQSLTDLDQILGG